MRKVSISMPEEILNVVDLIAERKYEDRSTAVRQLLAEAMKEEILRMCFKGKLTQREAASILKVSLWEFHDLAKEHQIPLGDYPVNEAEERIKRIKKRILKTTA